jgi:uncharacterized protein
VITATNVIVLLAMLVGTVGIVVPVLPGLFVVWGATLVWALERQDGPGWLVLGIATVMYAVGLVAQYLLPGRRMRSAGVEGWIVAIALAVAVVGFFVIPVVGLVIGGVAAVFLAELNRLGDAGSAWRSTRAVLLGVGLGVLIELTAGLLAILVWVAGVLAT